jgi:hypothetical protein
MAGTDPTTRLGRDASGRFRLPAYRSSHLSAVGRLAQATTRFGALIARSLTARRMLAGSEPVPVGSLNGVGVRPVALPLLAATWEQRRPQRLLSLAERQQRAVQEASNRLSGIRPASPPAPPRGLPTAIGRRRHSSAGANTGPAAAVGRMTAETAVVRNPSEVRSAGPMLTAREASRGARPPGPGLPRSVGSLSIPTREARAATAFLPFRVSPPSAERLRPSAPGGHAAPTPPLPPARPPPSQARAPTTSPSPQLPRPAHSTAPPTAGILRAAPDNRPSDRASHASADARTARRVTTALPTRVTDASPGAWSRLLPVPSVGRAWIGAAPPDERWSVPSPPPFTALRGSGSRSMASALRLSRTPVDTPAAPIGSVPPGMARIPVEVSLPGPRVLPLALVAAGARARHLPRATVRTPYRSPAQARRVTGAPQPTVATPVAPAPLLRSVSPFATARHAGGPVRARPRQDRPQPTSLLPYGRQPTSLLLARPQTTSPLPPDGSPARSDRPERAPGVVAEVAPRRRSLPLGVATSAFGGVRPYMSGDRSTEPTQMAARWTTRQAAAIEPSMTPRSSQPPLPRPISLVPRGLLARRAGQRQPGRPPAKPAQRLGGGLAGRRPWVVAPLGTNERGARAELDVLPVGPGLSASAVADRSPRRPEVVASELVGHVRPSALPTAPAFSGPDRKTRPGPIPPTDRLLRSLIRPTAAPPASDVAGRRMTWGTQGLPVGTGGGFLKALSGNGGRAAGDRLRATLGLTPPIAGLAGSSLVERTAHLFTAGQRQGRSGRPAGSAGIRRAAASSATDRRPDADRVDLTEPRPGDPPIIRRGSWPRVMRREGSAIAEIGESSAALSGEQLALLIDAIEQRIIDELERRGRRHFPGVF